MNPFSITSHLSKSLASAAIALSLLLSSTPTPVAAAQTVPVKLVRTTIKEVVASNHLEINVNYPQVISPTAKLTGFNAAAQKQATDIVANFKSETPVPSADAPVLTSTVQMDYQVMHNRKGLLSLRSLVGFYTAGAAHPNSYSVVINYDVDAGKGIDLVDLFKPETKYLEILSIFCTANLKRRGRLDFPEGAEPRLENYDAWNITPRGLLINFDPYQVTPYAAGPQQCLVPIATLSKSLKDPARLR